MRLRIASRKSDLARLQSAEVAAHLKRVHPSLEIEFHFSESLGDKNLTDPLWKMPEKGVFTEDLTRDLIDGRADLIVHSWKDLPVEVNPQTEIVATLPRADVRDLLLFKKSSLPLMPDVRCRIFSSSPRREFNLRPFLKDALPGGVADVEFNSVRGNIQTRVRKLLETADIDGLVVAKAALDRLLSAEAAEFAETRAFLREALSKCRFMVLPLSTNPAAPAQGALAIEIRRDRADVRELLAGIHHAPTFREANEERQVLKSHGGGCHQKIGCTVLERPEGKLRFLRGRTDKGLDLSERTIEGSATGLATVMRSDALFERKSRPGPFQLRDKDALFVSRAAAWPEGASFEGILWTAGLSTWKKMASKGFWVSGSAEGLGEKEDFRLSILAPGLKWATLTHGSAPAVQGSESIPTYDLVPRAQAVKPEGETLHWTSARLFEEALKRWPDLKDRRHSCGPGKTWDVLKTRIPSIQRRWPAPDKGD